MTVQDQVIVALTAWRENRGGGVRGMQSVINVIMNRSARHRMTPYSECVRPLQFSSITAKGDPELSLWPLDNEAAWLTALDLAAQAASGALEDITGGADLYYAPAGQPWRQRFTLPNGTEIPFPDTWNLNAVQYTCTIQGQVFFR